jgi:FAR-17a/AIG1-like protein
MIPSALLVLDILFLSPPWTITPVPAIGLSAAIAFAYWFWIELCYQNNGWYAFLLPPPPFPPSRCITKVILQKVSIPTLHNARHSAADRALLSQRSADGSCDRCVEMALWPRQRKGRNEDRVRKCERGLSEMFAFLTSGL